MSRFRHKVIKDCFIGDVYRTPDKHNIVVTAKPFYKPKADKGDEAKMKRDGEPLPSALTPMDYGFDKDGNPDVDDSFASQDVPEEDPINATDDALALADEFGIPIESVEGTGKDGRVTKGDVKKIVEDIGD